MNHVTFTLKMPVAADELGRWMEAHGACISMQCMLGEWHVHIAKKKVHSYNSDLGMHSEHWEVSRYNRDVRVALESALRAAGALPVEEPAEIPQALGAPSDGAKAALCAEGALILEQEGWLAGRMAHEGGSRLLRFAARYEAWKQKLDSFRVVYPGAWPVPPDNS